MRLTSIIWRLYLKSIYYTDGKTKTQKWLRPSQNQADVPVKVAGGLGL